MQARALLIPSEQPIPEVRVQPAGAWPPFPLRSHCPERLFHRENRRKRTRNTPEGDTENSINVPKGGGGSWLYPDILVVVAEAAVSTRRGCPGIHHET